MKNILYFIFVLSSISFSCSQNGNNSHKDKEIQVWHIQTTGNGPIIKEMASERFMKNNSDYKVSIEPMLNDPYKTKLKIALGANAMPDVFITWTGGSMIDYIKAGKLLDLTPYMEAEGYKDKFIKTSLNQAMYDGKIWAVPIENTIIAAIFYDKELFSKNGWKVPSTISELEILADKMLAKGIKPFALANKTKWTGSMYYMYLVDRIGGKDVFYNAANRINGGTFEDSVFIEAGKKLVEWVDKGYFNDGFNGLDDDSGQSRALLYTSKAAMYLTGTWFLTTLVGENPDFLNRVDMFLFPAYEGGMGNAKSVIGTLGDNFYSISKTSKNPDAAFELIKYFIDDDSIKNKLADGALPPVNKLQVSDAKLQKILNAVNDAPYVQLWYDQYLPSELAEVHKDLLQAMMVKTMTPEEASKELEAAAVKILGQSK